MYVGTYGDVLFSVSQLRVLTPSNISGSTGADWADHAVLNGKPKSQYMSPKLKKYQMDIQLSSSFGVAPRIALNRLQEMSERGEVHYLIIGLVPLSMNKFAIESITDTWDDVGRMGVLMECKVSLTFREYV
ncbi:MAG: phage tail protein [Faecalibacterium sp.]